MFHIGLEGGIGLPLPNRIYSGGFFTRSQVIDSSWLRTCVVLSYRINRVHKGLLSVPHIAPPHWINFSIEAGLLSSSVWISPLLLHCGVYELTRLSVWWAVNVSATITDNHTTPYYFPTRNETHFNFFLYYFHLKTFTYHKFYIRRRFLINEPDAWNSKTPGICSNCTGAGDARWLRLFFLSLGQAPVLY